MVESLPPRKPDVPGSHHQALISTDSNRPTVICISAIKDHRTDDLTTECEDPHNRVEEGLRFGVLLKLSCSSIASSPAQLQFSNSYDVKEALSLQSLSHASFLDALENSGGTGSV